MTPNNDVHPTNDESAPATEPRLAADLHDSPRQVASLWFLGRQRQCTPIRSQRLITPTQASQQVRPSRVHELVFRQLASREQFVDDRESLLGAIRHRDRCRSVQFHDRRRPRCHQHIVDADNLPPVRFVRGARLGMNRRDRRLQRIRAEASRAEGSFREATALVDLVAAPQRAVLLLEHQHLSVGRGPRCAARFVEQHQ